MSSEFTLEREQWNFYLLRFLEFDVNVFKAILSIQRIFNLTEYREVSLKKSLLIMHMWKKADLKYWGKFNKTFTSVIYKCSYCLRILRQQLHIKITLVKVLSNWPMVAATTLRIYRTTNSFFKQIDSLINEIYRCKLDLYNIARTQRGCNCTFLYHGWKSPRVKDWREFISSLTNYLVKH